MLKSIKTYPASDKEIFIAGYSKLCEKKLSGGHALEICGGHGVLTAEMAKAFPDCKISGLDRYIPTTAEAQEAILEYKNLEYLAGDAFNLSRFTDNSLNLIWGQAALHHLAHDSAGIAKEASRALKPGGRLIFIFEPLGHNYFVAAIRAIRMARGEIPDESNLYFSQFKEMSKFFRKTEVQVFNILGYPVKALSERFQIISKTTRLIDRHLINCFPTIKRYCANCNLIFVK
jgi:ubiquinone/menaquinone biosynthesis C-methylase UbiE